MGVGAAERLGCAGLLLVEGTAPLVRLRRSGLQSRVLCGDFCAATSSSTILLRACESSGQWTDPSKVEVLRGAHAWSASAPLPEVIGYDSGDSLRRAPLPERRAARRGSVIGEEVGNRGDAFGCETEERVRSKSDRDGSFG
jgi:hypothetical protein